MAEKIVMPKLGNTVESVRIVAWRKELGEAIAIGESICEVETDKSTIEVEAEVAGTLLARLYEADDDVPVLRPFAIVGEPGEDVAGLLRSLSPAADPPSSVEKEASTRMAAPPAGDSGISPRARNLISASGLMTLPAGSGPAGRIIERDIRAALNGRSLSPAARALSMDGDVRTSLDSSFPDFPGPFISVPVKGVRKVIAQRMHASLQETAQLTLNSSAPASSLLAWRDKYKNSPQDCELTDITINDFVIFTVSRLLPRHPEINAQFQQDCIEQYRHVHLGCAVDTPKGLMVPVLRFADQLSLIQISAEIRRLASACREGRINPDELSGATFTVSNLGALGIESFTPILNAPQVGILGVGSMVNAPLETPEGIGMEKRMTLSLTINHQAIDGAPAARFLKELCAFLGSLEWAFGL